MLGLGDQNDPMDDGTKEVNECASCKRSDEAMK